MESAPHILCVSWDPSLAKTRELLLLQYGYQVTSALGAENSIQRCSTNVDLLLLGHSVPRNHKQEILNLFRTFNSSPALSLLAPGQEPLPNVDFAVEFLNPAQLIATLHRILPPRHL